MKKQIISLVLAGSLLLSAFPSYAAQEQIQTTQTSLSRTSLSDFEYQEGTVLVTIASPRKTSLTKKGRTSFDENIEVEKSYDFGDASIMGKTGEQKDFLSDKTLYVSKVSSDSYSTDTLIDKLEDKAYVLSVEPDYVQHLFSLTEDAYSGEQWYLDSGSNYSGQSKGISFSSAKEKTKTGTPVIAVMDTGINYEHEDLSDHMWVNPCQDKGLQGIYGYNFIDSSAYCMDDNGHGTHCAGIIAATADNQTGIAGISNAKLMSLKVFDEDGEGNNSLIIDALYYIYQAKQAGVNVTAVNCSWGGGSSEETIPQLVQQIGSMGTLFVFAAGNDGINHDNSELSCPYDLYRGTSPASNRNYIIIVGASDPDDSPAGYSDYGKMDVDLFAPGSRIVSTYMEDTYFAGIYDSEKEEQLTQHFLSFDSQEQTGQFSTDNDLGIISNIANIQSSYQEDIDYRESTDSGSLLLTIQPGLFSALPRKNTYLYLDVTEDNPDINATYYISMLKGTEGTGGKIIWKHVVETSSGSYGSQSNRFYKTLDGKIYLKIYGISLSGLTTGISSYYFDDIGISVANPDTTQFGQYKLLNGTSMAAPMVTGAVALLNEIYPGDSSTDCKNRLLSCVRVNSAVSGKCRTNGILDLSNMDNYIPSPSPTTESSTPQSAPEPSAANVTNSVSPVSPTTSSVKSKITVKKVKMLATAKKTYQTKQKTKSGKTKTVTKTKKVKMNNSKFTLCAGDKLKLTASVSPVNASNKNVTWSSSRKKWAFVTKNGVVTAKKKGKGHTVKITATAKDGSRKKAVCKIKIKK